MVLDIMSAPPLPSRVVKGRPLPSAPHDQPLSHAPSIKERRLPPTPDAVSVPATLDRTGQNATKSRPLPPPPTNEQTAPTKLSAQNGESTLRRGLPPVPLESSPVTHHGGSLRRQQSGGSQGNRPLPPPPNEETSHPVSSSSQQVNSNYRNVFPPAIHVESSPVTTQTGTLRKQSGASQTNRPLPPPPNGDTSNPVSSSIHQLDINHDNELAPPRLPVRKSTLPRKHNVEEDFEKRFYFHEMKDLPQPEEFEDKPKKYSSTSQNNRNKHRRRKKTSPT